MEKIKILIVEKEFNSDKKIKESLYKVGYNITGTTQSYTGAMKLISNSAPDIALIDIELSGTKTGIDLGLNIRKNFNFPFIFMSDYSETKIVDDTVKSLSDAYLKRPFKEKDLFLAIENALTNFSKKKPVEKGKSVIDNIHLNDTIFIKKNSFYTKVKLENILYIRSEGNYLEIITTDKKKFLIRSSFRNFLNYLPADIFLRIHNSYVININYITKITHSNLFVNDYKIPISRNRKNEILKRMSFFS